MIKIVHIAKPIGGVGVYIHLISKHINSVKFQNEIICNTTDDIISLENTNGAKTPHHHVNLQREISLINDLKCLKRIINLIKEINPDIIHCHSAKAGVLGRIAGNHLNIPTLYTPHAYSYLSSENKTKQYLFKYIEQKFKHKASKTLACSLSEYNRTINELGFPKEKVIMWNNSVEKINRTVTPKIQEQLPEEYICSIGRPSYQKNTELLINAIYKVKETIPNIHLVILGAGLYSPLLEKIKDLINQLNLSENVTLIPWLAREESLTILKNSLFLVSSSRYEGLSYAVIEALALSKACILTNVDGNKDLVKNNQNGFLVNENSEDLANKITILHNDKALLSKFSKASYEMFTENFEITKNIKQLENIYENTLK